MREGRGDGTPTTVVFDIGGVLLDWNPRYLFRKLFDDKAAMEDFLARVCTPEWNHRQDAGRAFAEAVAELTARFPEFSAMIAAYDHRWDEMVPGVHQATVDLLYRLKGRGVPLLALTNFSTEKLPRMRQRYAFFDCFDGMVVSGEIGLTKPDAAIFLHLLSTYALAPADCLFIDDLPANVAAAERVGMRAIRYTCADALKAALLDYGLLKE